MLGRSQSERMLLLIVCAALLAAAALGGCKAVGKAAVRASDDVARAITRSADDAARAASKSGDAIGGNLAGAGARPGAAALRESERALEVVWLDLRALPERGVAELGCRVENRVVNAGRSALRNVVAKVRFEVSKLRDGQSEPLLLDDLTVPVGRSTLAVGEESAFAATGSCAPSKARIDVTRRDAATRQLLDRFLSNVGVRVSFQDAAGTIGVRDKTDGRK